MQHVSALHSFLGVNTIPLYGWITLCLSTDGHVVCFHLLASVNNVIYVLYFCVWLLLLPVLFVRSVHVAVTTYSLFILLAVSWSTVWTYHCFSLSILLLMDFGVVSSSWLITDGAMSVPEYVFGECICTFLLDIYLGEELLGHRVCVCVISLFTSY